METAQASMDFIQDTGIPGRLGQILIVYFLLAAIQDIFLDRARKYEGLLRHIGNHPSQLIP